MVGGLLLANPLVAFSHHDEQHTIDPGKSSHKVVSYNTHTHTHTQNLKEGRKPNLSS
jgi:hypothetical protein